jgi:excinuclease UvrABC nuclease subunit
MSIKSWSTFHTPFNEAEVKRVVPTNGGVYALWVNYKSGRWDCYYIGKAENLERRLLEHLADAEPNICIKENRKYKCGFLWMEISTESERSGAEKFLYDKLKPECNEADPGGAAQPISLPPTPANTEARQ